jgi:hypothetical protein
VFCSGGVYALIDLSLDLVEKFCGHENRPEVREIAAHSEDCPEPGLFNVSGTLCRAKEPLINDGAILDVYRVTRLSLMRSWIGSLLMSCGRNRFAGEGRCWRARAVWRV